VKIVKGSVNIITLSGKNDLTPVQIANQNKVYLQRKELQIPVSIKHLESSQDLRNLSKFNSGYIICWMDKKPDIWRKFGLTNSQLTSLGPIPSIPLIALHR